MLASRWSSLRFVAGVVVAGIVVAAAHPVLAQEDRIRPVTDAELESPSPDEWLMWRRTLDGWGYSPLDQIDRDNVGDLRMVWSRALGPGTPAGDAARPRRRDVHAEPAGHHPGHRRRDRRPRLGVPPRPARRPRRVHDRHPHRDQPQRRHPRRAHLRHHHGRPHRRPPRRDRRGGVGHRDPRLPGEPRQPDLGAHRRRRQGVLGPELRPPGRARRLRHHRPRRRHRRGAVADGASSPPPASPATRRGATCPTRSAGTSARGWSRASTPS